MKVIVTLWILTFSVPAFGQEFITRLAEKSGFTSIKLSISSVIARVELNEVPNRIDQNPKSAKTKVLRINEIYSHGIRPILNKPKMPCLNCYWPKLINSSKRMNNQVELNKKINRSLLNSNNSIYLVLDQISHAARFKYVVELSISESDNPFGFSIIYKKR